MLKRFIMENLPSDQSPRDLDILVSNIQFDLRSSGRIVDLLDIFNAFKELHNTQDLFMFSNGTVIATRKGLKSYD
jgi:hypothetical protein